MPFYQDRITVSLGLPELEAIRVEETKQKENWVWVKKRELIGCCPLCGKVTDKIHSRWESKVRDLPLLGQKTFLIVERRRLRCGNGCRPFLEEIGCLEKYKRQTKRYRRHLEASCRHSSLSEVSRKEGVGYKQLDRLYYENAEEKVGAIEKQPLPQVLGIDEFSGKKRVRMHLAVTDLTAKPRLWDVMKTKGALEFMEFFSKWTKEARDEVQTVVHDMDQGLKSWTTVMFRKALHVADKFHVIRTLLKHLERVRKAGYRKSTSFENRKKIRSAYFLIRKRFEKMSQDQKQQLEELFLISGDLKEAYEIKEAFCCWYDQPKRRVQAETEFYALYDQIRRTPYLKRFSWVLDHWREEILNYFALPYSNGFTEGMNNKIKTLKRQAYGFRNFDRFRMRIMNECAWN